VCNAVQLSYRSASMLVGMMQCAYCERSATLKIPSTPEQVCFEHAVEF